MDEDKGVALQDKPDSRKALSPGDVHTISRVLSDPRRFEILKHIAAQSCTACSDLRVAFPITAATLSHHLKELESSGLISTSKRGKFVDTAFCRSRWRAYLAELRKL